MYVIIPLPGKRAILALWGALVIGLIGPTVPADDLQPSRESVRLLIQEGSFDLALGWLSQGQVPADSFFAGFQRAYCLQQLKRWEEAISLYEELMVSSSSLEGYLRLFLATCYARSGRGEKAEDQLVRLLDGENYLLMDEARELLAQVYLELGRIEEAIRIFEFLASSSNLKARQPEFQLSIGRALYLAGQTDEAALLLGKILKQYPATAEALEALQELPAIRAKPLVERELFNAARIYFNHHRYEEAAEGWSRFVELYPESPQAAEALFLSAKASYRGEHYFQAEARCGQLLQAYPRSGRVTSAHYLIARCAEADGRTALAERLYGQFVSEYPWSQLADDVLWQLAGLHERRGDLAAAQREYLALFRQYAGRERATEALWRAGLYAFSSGDNATACALFDRLRNRYPRSPLASGALYWSGRAHQRAGTAGVARQLLERVIQLDPQGYYAQRARTRLEKNGAPPGKRDFADLEVLLGEESEGRHELNGAVSHHYQRGKALLHLGLLVHGRRELSEVHKVIAGSPREMVDLLRLYGELQLYGDALRLAQRAKKNLDQPHWQESLEPFLYPLSYLETVTAEAERYDLEPFFVLSVIRVESRFDPLAVSPAGARGLMQIMPSTGREIREQLGLTATSFLRPQFNIRLGTYYLWRQLEEFGGRPEMALAAYNAGPGNVRRWLRRLGPVDPEYFVELIAFPETREFVKRVLATQAHYRRVWGVRE